jgi:spore coat protein U-like protein
MTLRRIWKSLAVLLLLAPVPATAQTCNFSISSVSFGNVNILGGAAVDVTGTVTFNCSGYFPGTTVQICPSIGEGTGGATATERRMLSGANVLNFQLYSDSARTTIWGSYFWSFPARPPTVNLPIGSNGTGSTSLPIFARILVNQQTVPPGTYLSTFSGAYTRFRYRGFTFLGCASMLFQSEDRPTFTATATVLKNCLVTAQDIHFGTHGVLTSNVDASGQLGVRCTAGTPYTVGLSNGLTGGSPAARRMTKGSEFVTYGLCRDAGHTQPWGNVTGTMASGTGTGLVQNLTVFGRVPPQATPSPGNYADTVAVTVTY